MTATSPFRAALNVTCHSVPSSFLFAPNGSFPPRRRTNGSHKSGDITPVTSLQLSCSHDSGTVAMVIHHAQLQDGDLISMWMTLTDHILIPAVNGIIHDLEHILGRNLLTVLCSIAVVRAGSTSEDQGSKPDQFKQSKTREKKKTFGENAVSSASW